MGCSLPMIYLQKIKQYSFHNKLNAAKKILNLCCLIIAGLKFDFPKMLSSVLKLEALKISTSNNNFWL
jgi:hypothetical protein